MKISLFTPHEIVGFFLAWAIIWFVHSGINGKPFNSFLVVASFIGLVLLKVFADSE